MRILIETKNMKYEVNDLPDDAVMRVMAIFRQSQFNMVLPPGTRLLSKKIYDGFEVKDNDK